MKAARSIDDEYSRLLALEKITSELVKACLIKNVTEGTEVGSAPEPFSPSDFTPPPTAPATHFTTLRTVWDPSSRDFIWDTEKPDETVAMSGGVGMENHEKNKHDPE